jgi:hypothetical protein
MAPFAKFFNLFVCSTYLLLKHEMIWGATSSGESVCMVKMQNCDVDIDRFWLL